MIAKAKVISHGANAIRYSVDKDKAEIVKTNLLPDDISQTAMWARMLALQKKFEDKLNRYHPLKRNMIRIEVSPTSEGTQGWTMEDWQMLADDFIREFDAVDLSAKSKRKSAKATNLPEFGISDCRFSCYARFPIGAYYICPPNNMDGKMQEL